MRDQLTNQQSQSLDAPVAFLLFLLSSFFAALIFRQFTGGQLPTGMYWVAVGVILLILACRLVFLANPPEGPEESSEAFVGFFVNLFFSGIWSLVGLVAHFCGYVVAW